MHANTNNNKYYISHHLLNLFNKCFIKIQGHITHVRKENGNFIVLTAWGGAGGGG